MYVPADDYANHTDNEIVGDYRLQYVLIATIFYFQNLQLNTVDNFSLGCISPAGIDSKGNNDSIVRQAIWLACRHWNGQRGTMLVAILISLDIKRQLQCTDSSDVIIKQAAFAELATSNYVAQNELHTTGCNMKPEPVVIVNTYFNIKNRSKFSTQYVINLLNS